MSCTSWVHIISYHSTVFLQASLCDLALIMSELELATNIYFFKINILLFPMAGHQISLWTSTLCILKWLQLLLVMLAILLVNQFSSECMRQALLQVISFWISLREFGGSFCTDAILCGFLCMAK